MSNCALTLPNTGFNACTANDLGEVRSVILSARKLEFANESAAIVETNMDALIKAENKAQRAFPLPDIFKIEPANDESVLEAGNDFSVEVKKHGGIDKFHAANIPTKLKNRLIAAFNNKTIYAFYIHANNYLVGVTDESTGLKVKMEKVRVIVSEMKQTGTELYKLTYSVQRLEVSTSNNYGIAVKPAYNLREKTGLSYVTIAIKQPLVAANTAFTATVTDELTGVAVTGLVVADFINLKAGVTNALTSAADNGDGTYLITPTDGVTAGSYTFNIKAPADIADADLFIESPKATAYTVSGDIQ